MRFFILIFSCSALAWIGPLAPKKFPVRGQFSSPYFLLNGHDAKTGISLSYYVSAKGRVIWVIPATQVAPFNDPNRVVFSKPASLSSVWQLRPYRQSALEEVDWQGKVLRRMETHGYPVHHDFFVGSDHAIYFLSDSLKKFRTRLNGPVQTYLGSPLMRLDLTTLKVRELWDYLSSGNLLSDGNWIAGTQDSGQFFALPGLPPADHDAVHANSLDYQPKRRFLLSFRTLDKIVLLDDQFKVRWKLGPVRKGVQDAFEIPFDFYRQHHANFTSDGGFLVFDNGQKKSRILKFSLDENGLNPRLERIFEPKTPIFSQRYGSALEEPNGNILGFFPHTSSETQDVDHLIEFDKKTGEAVAQMDINYGTPASGYRAYPVAEIPKNDGSGWNVSQLN